MSYIRKRVLESGKTRYYPVLSRDGKELSLGGYSSRRDAKAALQHADSEVANGTFQRRNPRFSDFYTEWIAAKAAALKGTTRVSYEHTFRNHILPYFGGLHLDDIDPDQVQRWVVEMQGKGLAPATVRRAYRYLTSCVNVAVERGYMDNPFRSIILPRQERKEVDCLKMEELGYLADAAPEPYDCLFKLLAYTGARVGEALALRWRNVSFKDNAILIIASWSPDGGFTEPKSKAGRRAVPMMATLRAALLEYYGRQGEPDPDALLFPGKAPGKPLHFSSVSRAWHAARKVARLREVSPHSARHTFATTLIGQGASIKAVQVALGHSTVTLTLNVYGHLLESDLAGALERADLFIQGVESGQVVRLKAG